MQILNYLKLFLTFLLFIIRDNIGKSILILISIIAYQFFGTFEDTKYEVPISKTVSIGDDTLHICLIATNSGSYFDIIDNKDSDYKIEGDKISWIEESSGDIITSILFFISIVAVILLTLFGFDNDDIGWDIRESWRDALRLTVYTIYEENTYYYMSFGRLLGKRDTLISRRNLRYELNINSLSDILYCPKFQTKTQKRENLLSKIGIK